MADARRLPTKNFHEMHDVRDDMTHILELFGYRSCDAATKANLESKTQRIAMLQTQPVHVLR